MSTSFPSSRWRPLPSSSLIDVFVEDADIEDVIPLSGPKVPRWLNRLSIPADWQLVELPDGADPALARLVVCGPRGNGEWEAADTISVFGYTGWPVFYDLFHNADHMLRELNATGIAVQVLPVPPIQHAAALRCNGTATIGDRSVWVQQSNYVAGSELPNASRLIVHSMFVDSECRARLAEDATRLADAVYQGYVAALLSDNRTG